MNPFTKSIAARLRSPELPIFIDRWDRLEALVIHVFRAKAATADDESNYTELRSWLQQHYGGWQASLEPLWRQAMRGGEPSEDDPFLFVMQTETADHFVNNLACMRALPAAREALNRLILTSQHADE